MKTQISHKVTGVILILMLHGITLLSQNKYTWEPKYGGGFETYMSSNGHGAFFMPYMSVYKGLSAFNFGPTIHKRSGITNGLKVQFSHNLTGSKNRHIKDEYFYYHSIPNLFQINFYSSVQYNGKLPLSYSAIKHEEKFSREPQPNWNKIRLSTAEVSSGLAFQLNFTNSLSWKAYVGASLYHHITYLKSMDHARTAAAINLGTSISLIIN